VTRPARHQRHQARTITPSGGRDTAPFFLQNTGAGRLRVVCYPRTLRAAPFTIELQPGQWFSPATGGDDGVRVLVTWRERKARR